MDHAQRIESQPIKGMNQALTVYFDGRSITYELPSGRLDLGQLDAILKAAVLAAAGIMADIAGDPRPEDIQVDQCLLSLHVMVDDVDRISPATRRALVQGVVEELVAQLDPAVERHIAQYAELAGRTHTTSFTVRHQRDF